MIAYNKIKIFKGAENLIINVLKIEEDQVTYEVSGTAICEYDQHSRARIGVKFFDYKVSDLPEYVFYSHVYNMLEKDIGFKERTLNILTELEEIRNKFSFKTSYNLMSRSCSYKVKQTFESLKGQMNRRLALCEESHIVSVHFLLREKLIQQGVEEAEQWLPACDFMKKCYYSQSDYLSNMFGVLFRGCGRWPDKSSYATFNESCSDVLELEEQLKIKFPKSQYEIDNNIR